jgi:hypothetical protein
MRRQWLIRAVGAFDDPAAGLDNEPVAGFRPRHPIDGDTGLGRGPADCLAGVARVEPHVLDTGRGPFRRAQQRGKRGPVLHVSCSDDGRDHQARGVDEDMAFTSSTFFAPSNLRGPATGEAVTPQEPTTPAVGRLRRPDRVRTSPGDRGKDWSPDAVAADGDRGGPTGLRARTSVGGLWDADR